MQRLHVVTLHTINEENRRNKKKPDRISDERTRIKKNSYLPLVLLFEGLAYPCLGLIPDPSDLPKHLFSAGIVCPLRIRDTSLIQCQPILLLRIDIKLQVVLNRRHLPSHVFLLAFRRAEVVFILLFR